MEEALQDRISFRRFVGLGLQDDTPDYSTSAAETLKAQLDERGLGHVRRPPRRAAAPRVRPIPMRTGPRPTVGGGPTSATKGLGKRAGACRLEGLDSSLRPE